MRTWQMEDTDSRGAQGGEGWRTRRGSRTVAIMVHVEKEDGSGRSARRPRRSRGGEVVVLRWFSNELRASIGGRQD